MKDLAANVLWTLPENGGNLHARNSSSPSHLVCFTLDAKSKFLIEEFPKDSHLLQPHPHFATTGVFFLLISV